MVIIRPWNSCRWKSGQTANWKGQRSMRWKFSGHWLWPWRRVTDQPGWSLTASSDPSFGSSSSTQSSILSRSPSRYPLHPRRWWSGSGWSICGRWSWTSTLLAYGMERCRQSKPITVRKKITELLEYFFKVILKVNTLTKIVMCVWDP